MSRIVVKVCGVTEERDAIEASLLGVDAIGFRFSEGGPRGILPEAARRISDRLPALVGRVGVFAGDPLIRVLEVARTAGLTSLELRGSEDAGFCAALAPYAWYRAVPFRPATTAEWFEGYPCTTFLLDGSAWPGGGEPDWKRARSFSLHGRLILSGAFDPESVLRAIEAARPYGIDVSRSVEIAPGKLDVDKLEAVVEAVRRAERDL